MFLLFFQKLSCVYFTFRHVVHFELNFDHVCSFFNLEHLLWRGLSWQWPSRSCLSDLYVYAVLVCCVGILSVLLFTLTIIWQSVFSKRKSRGKRMDKVMSGVRAQANHRQTEDGWAKYHFGWKTHPESGVIYLWLASKVSGGGMSPLDSAKINCNHCWHHCTSPLFLKHFLLWFLSALTSLFLPEEAVVADDPGFDSGSAT